jgi:TonB family protein
MRTTFVSAVCLLFVVVVASAQQDPVVISRGPLLYPPVARAARVSGTVNVEFKIKADGATDSVTAVEGPAMLRGAAETLVKSWRFDARTLTGESDTKYTTTVAFKAVDGVVDPRTGNDVTIHADGFRHFEISIVVSDIEMSNCPTGTDEDAPSQHSISDYVQIARSSCYGTCPSYSVRVNADGTVLWDGEGFVAVTGKRTAHIDVGIARKLLEKFRTAAFWSIAGTTPAE